MGARGFKPLRREWAISQIEELISERELWGRRLPGEREMAESLGISRGTLQKALAQLEARGTVERRHGSGTYAVEKGRLRRRQERRCSRVCVLTPVEYIPANGVWSYYGDMLKGVLRGARRAGIDAAIRPLEEYWNEVPGSLWSRLREFDGFIVVQRDDYALMSALLKLGRGPVVALDSYLRDVPVIGIVDGSFEGARKAVRYLLHQGHRRIAYIAPGEHAENPHEKTQGYRAALAEAGIAFEAQLFCSPGHQRVDAPIRKAVSRFLALPARPTAIFAGTDNRALLALEELEKQGVSVGDEISLMGFGDSACRLGLCDRLTSMRIHTRQMGETAVRAVLDSNQAGEVRTMVVPNRLMVRGSTARAASPAARTIAAKE
jgi:DNA-binding LacI/PurR family transcriptional regulator